MKIEFVGAARTVTGSSYIIKNNNFTIMVDCGMFQGTRELRERNHLSLIYAPDKIDALVLTHAHIDHSGLVPKLVKEGFTGPIFATTATCDLLRVMLPDSAHIQEMDAEWAARRQKKAGREPLPPLYTEEDANASLKHLKPFKYGAMFDVVPGIKARFREAGHILGSAFIEMWIEENGTTKKIVFSGDIGPKDQAIIRDPEITDEADYLLIESTYGDRLHKSKPDTYAEFKEVINSTYNSKGNIVIPSFAVERTQEIIFTLGQLFKEGAVPRIPVYIDSPLAINATEIFNHNPDCFNQEMQTLMSGGINPLDFPNLHYVKTTEESKSLNEKAKGSIIISASGMCTAGRIKYHLQNNLYKPASTVLFVGYQAEGTLGRQLVDGAKRVRVYAEDVIVNAQIKTLGGFSAHADRNGLLEWMSSIKTKNCHVFVVHGEDMASESFAQAVKENYGFDVTVPRWGEIFDLETKSSEYATYGEDTSHLVPKVDAEFDALSAAISSVMDRYKALKDKGSLKGYRLSRFNEEMQDLKSMLHDIQEKM
jgi:metallo-beta-lactamase family protein